LSLGGLVFQDTLERFPELQILSWVFKRWQLGLIIALSRSSWLVDVTSESPL
ncbi:hypothetical protein NDU88_000147, partial [Pleurodeles waltl]